MNYQVTCVCGNSFFINDQQVSTTVTCPACKRELLPVVSASNAPGYVPPTKDVPLSDSSRSTDAVTASADATKRCPFCGEVILAVAKKCKHCGEFLDRAAPPPSPPLGYGTSPSDVPPAPVFVLSVSQWDNFWKYLICIALAILVSGGLIVLAQRDIVSKEAASLGVPATLAVLGMTAWLLYLAVKNSRCFIRPTRIDTEVGILSKDLNSIELFRITDMELKQSFIGRILGIGTIRISSNDPKNPELLLYQIPKARRVHKYLQDQIPVATRQRGAVFFER